MLEQRLTFDCYNHNFTQKDNHIEMRQRLVPRLRAIQGHLLRPHRELSSLSHPSRTSTLPARLNSTTAHPLQKKIAHPMKQVKYPGQQAVVICGFAGIGKTHLQRSTTTTLKGWKVIDLDSSNYKTNFPVCYWEALMPYLTRSNTIVLVGTHEVWRQLLVTKGVEFTAVYPQQQLKNIWIEERLRKRTTGVNDGVFCDLMYKNWDSWIGSLRGQEGCGRRDLGRNMYISDVIGDIVAGSTA